MEGGSLLTYHAAPLFLEYRGWTATSMCALLFGERFHLEQKCSEQKNQGKECQSHGVNTSMGQFITKFLRIYTAVNKCWIVTWPRCHFGEQNGNHSVGPTPGCNECFDLGPIVPKQRNVESISETTLEIHYKPNLIINDSLMSVVKKIFRLGDGIEPYYPRLSMSIISRMHLPFGVLNSLSWATPSSIPATSDKNTLYFKSMTYNI